VPSSSSVKLAASSESDDLVDALVQASFVTMAELSKLGAEYDLSLTQLRVLGILRDRRLRMTDLADFLGLEKSTMSGLADRAARRGLLGRAPNPQDGRATDLFLTESGRQLADRMHADARHALSFLTDALSSAEQKRLQVLLERTLALRTTP
jgi:DNA-binding MarR family transcriptional regulator